MSRRNAQGRQQTEHIFVSGRTYEDMLIVDQFFTQRRSLLEQLDADHQTATAYLFNSGELTQLRNQIVAHLFSIVDQFLLFDHIRNGNGGSTCQRVTAEGAAVYATLTTIKSEGLVDKVAEKGEYFKNELRKLQEKYPDKVTDVRGCGLMLGMEVAGEGKLIVESCLANNVIVNCTAGNVIRIVPPLIISREEIDIVVAALDKALAAC